VDVKTAYVRGLDSFAIKIVSGFLDNYKQTTAEEGIFTNNSIAIRRCQIAWG